MIFIARCLSPVGVRQLFLSVNPSTGIRILQDFKVLRATDASNEPSGLSFLRYI